jgi:hypothetical protein
MFFSPDVAAKKFELALATADHRINRRRTAHCP